jgi:HSP20 family protein
MKLVRYSPFSSLVEDFFNQEMPSFASNGNTLRSIPSVNIKENEQGYSIEVAAPGLEKQDFHIDLDQDTLKISVSKESKSEESKEGYSRKEFSYHSFSRAFTLPKTIDASKIKAGYEQGILQIDLPKRMEEIKTPKRIEIA